MNNETKEVLSALLAGRTYVFSLLHTLLGAEPSRQFHYHRYIPHILFIFLHVPCTSFPGTEAVPLCLFFFCFFLSFVGAPDE